MLLRPIFAQKIKTASPQRDLGAEIRSCEGVSVIRTEEPFEFVISAGKSVSISVKTFFFFWHHLFLGGKTVWISDFDQKIRLNFGEDLFFLEITCFWAKKPPQSDSRAMKMWVKVAYSCLNLPKKPPSPFTKSWLRACSSRLKGSKLVPKFRLVLH